MRCYRLQEAHEDPQRQLTEAGQWTDPWGGAEDGERCDKCRGRGKTRHECWSCLITGTDRSCASCHGRVRWEDTCPVCRGGGKVEGKPRRGVSAFPTAEGLYHYLLARDADLVGMLVELEAEPAEDVDFRADEGAILVIPTSIARISSIEPEAIDTIRALIPKR